MRKKTTKDHKKMINYSSSYYNKMSSFPVILYREIKNIYVIIYPIKMLKIWNMLKRVVLINLSVL